MMRKYNTKKPMDFVIYNQIVEKHTVARKSLSSLYEISERDYTGKNYFPKDRNISALDMDGYAENFQPNPSSVDAVLGICSYDGNQRKNERLLFVELKIDVTSAASIKKSDYIAKEDDTKTMLGMEIPIDSKVFFVFSTKMYAVAFRTIDSLNRETHRNWEATTANDFLTSKLHDANKVQYQSPNNLAQAEKDLMSSIDAGLEKFYYSLEYWQNKMDSYYYSNRAEYKAIGGMLLNVKGQYANVIHASNDEDENFVLNLISIIFGEIESRMEFVGK